MDTLYARKSWLCFLWAILVPTAVSAILVSVAISMNNKDNSWINNPGIILIINVFLGHLTSFLVQKFATGPFEFKDIILYGCIGAILGTPLGMSIAILFS
jgi:hypothetical protein